MLFVALFFEELDVIDFRNAVSDQLDAMIVDDSQAFNAFFAPDYFLDPKQFFFGMSAYDGPRISELDNFSMQFNVTQFLESSTQAMIDYNAKLTKELEELAKIPTNVQKYATATDFFRSPLAGHTTSKDLIFVIGDRIFSEQIRHFAGAYDRIWIFDTCGNNAAEKAFYMEYLSLFTLLNLNSTELRFDCSCSISLKMLARISEICDNYGAGKYKQRFGSKDFVKTASFQYIIVIAGSQRFQMDSRYILVHPYYKVFFYSAIGFTYEKKLQLTSNNTCVVGTIDRLVDAVVGTIIRETENYGPHDFAFNGVLYRSKGVFTGGEYVGFVTMKIPLVENAFFQPRTSPTCRTTSKMFESVPPFVIPLIDARADFPQQFRIAPARLTYNFYGVEDEKLAVITEVYMKFWNNSVRRSNYTYFQFGSIIGQREYQSTLSINEFFKPRVPRSYRVCDPGELASRPRNQSLDEEDDIIDVVSVFSSVKNLTCALNLSHEPETFLYLPFLTYFRQLAGQNGEVFGRCVTYYFELLMYARVREAESALESCAALFPHRYEMTNFEYFYNATGMPFSPYILDFLYDYIFELVNFFAKVGHHLGVTVAKSCIVFIDSAFQTNRQYILLDSVPKRREFQYMAQFFQAIDDMLIGLCNFDLYAADIDIEAFEYVYNRPRIFFQNGITFISRPIQAYGFTYGYRVEVVYGFNVETTEGAIIMIMNYNANIVYDNGMLDTEVFPTLFYQLVRAGVLEPQVVRVSCNFNMLYYSINYFAFYGYADDFGTDFDHEIIYAFLDDCYNITFQLYMIDSYSFLLVSFFEFNLSSCKIKTEMPSNQQFYPLENAFLDVNRNYPDLTERDEAYQVFVNRIQFSTAVEGKRESYITLIVAVLISLVAVLLLSGSSKVYADELLTSAEYAPTSYPAFLEAHSSGHFPETPMQKRTISYRSCASIAILRTPKKQVESEDARQLAPLFPADQTCLEQRRFIEEAYTHFLPSAFTDFLILDEENQRTALTCRQLQFPGNAFAFQKVKLDIMKAYTQYYSRELSLRPNSDYFAVSYAAELTAPKNSRWDSVMELSDQVPPVFNRAGDAPCYHRRKMSYYIADEELRRLVSPPGQLCERVGEDVIGALATRLEQLQQQAYQGGELYSGANWSLCSSYSASCDPGSIEGPTIVHAPRYLLQNGFFGRDLPGREVAAIRTDEIPDSWLYAPDDIVFEELVKLVTR